MTNEQFNPRIVKGYHCPSHSYCSGEWQLRNLGKWQEILDSPPKNFPFSTPLAPCQGEYYQEGGLMLVSMNFNNHGGEWDATGGVTDANGRFGWRDGMLFDNAAKFLVCLLKDERLRIDTDKYYVFANIIKCSPSNRLSPRSWPSLVQFHRCIVEEGHIKRELELYNPGILLCLGYEVYEQIMALYVNERLELGDVAKPINGVARLDRDTVALSLPHLSGGMRSMNTLNSRYRDSTRGIDHIEVLRGKSYHAAEQYLKSQGALWFDSNIVLTAMAYDMGRTLKEKALTVYQRIQDQLAER